LGIVVDGVVRGCSNGVLHGRTGIRSASQLEKEEEIKPAYELTERGIWWRRDTIVAVLW
jgi:hypothetical protein